MMLKIKKWVMKHKLLTIFGSLFIIFLIIMLVTVNSLFFSTGKSIYGDRLKGIDEVVITDSRMDEAKAKIENDAAVKEVNIHVKGKIINIAIDVVKDTSISKAKELAGITLQAFSDEEKNFYDFQYFLTMSEDSESVSFPITGTKHHKYTDISWTKDR
ncbi:MAG: hypothetical protein Q4G04_04750 [bacterium]|nr:hypothetical protein [bacterium]